MVAIILSIAIKTGSIAERATVTHLSLQRIGIDCSADGKTGSGYTYGGKRHHHFLHLLKWCLGFIAAPAVSREKFHRRMVHLSTTPLQRARFFYISFTTLSQVYLVISVSFYVILASFSLFLATLEEIWQFIHKFPQYADTKKPADGRACLEKTEEWWDIISRERR